MPDDAWTVEELFGAEYVTFATRVEDRLAVKEVEERVELTDVIC